MNNFEKENEKVLKSLTSLGSNISTLKRVNTLYKLAFFFSVAIAIYASLF